jgi:hypothetical protein
LTEPFAWQERYREALLEFDRERLAQRIVAAETAIYQRVEELKHGGAGSNEELWAINDAIRGLRALAKTECPGLRSLQAPASQGEVAP